MKQHTIGLNPSALVCLQMRFYEAVTPLQTQLAELNARKDTLAGELDLHRTQTKALMKVTTQQANTHLTCF